MALSRTLLLRSATILVLLGCSIHYLFTGILTHTVAGVYAVSLLVWLLSYLNYIRMRQLLVAHRSDLGIVLVVSFIALALYVFRVGEVTPGVWGDEIRVGIIAQELSQQSTLTPFVTTNYGHPTPLIYLTQVWFNLFGKSIITLRLTSLLFGAASVGMFYLLARRFFSRTEALLGVVLFASAYAQLVVVRFAYEMSASVFFMLAACLCLSHLQTKVTTARAVFFGVCIGLGMYTYLGFRPIALFLTLAAGLVIQRKAQLKKHFVVLTLATSMLLAPLAVFSILHRGALSERIRAVSIFTQNLTGTELFKELSAASYRTLTLFVFTPDPNPRHNPAGSTMFDLITVVLFLVGLSTLFRFQRKLFLFCVALVGLTLAIEIITFEKIPEFHYYGLGHPNTLRLLPIIPVVTFCALWGLRAISIKFSETSAKIASMVILTFVIAMINVNRYFTQPASEWIYQTNSVASMRIVDLVNNESPREIFLSSTLYESLPLTFFLHPDIVRHELTKPVDCELTKIPGFSAVSASDLLHCNEASINTQLNSQAAALMPIVNPWQTVDAVLVKNAQEM